MVRQPAAFGVSGGSLADHFADAGKMAEPGSGSKRKTGDFAPPRLLTKRSYWLAAAPLEFSPPISRFSMTARRISKPVTRSLSRSIRLLVFPHAIHIATRMVAVLATTVAPKPRVHPINVLFIPRSI